MTPKHLEGLIEAAKRELHDYGLLFTTTALLLETAGIDPESIEIDKGEFE